MTRTPIGRFAGASMLALALAAPVALSPILASPAHAFFGFGRIVYDPSNYAQNVLTAARTLEQINNQIQQLQNEAQMLINQARNLASLPYSSLQQLQQNVGRTQQLLQQAQSIAFDVGQIDQAFQQRYGNVALSATDAQLVADARARWETTVGSLQDALRVQAGVVGNIDTNRAEMSALVGQSQNATGALQATQAGNQLLALQSQQLSDMIALLSANGRAEALIEAERATPLSRGGSSASASSRRARATSRQCPDVQHQLKRGEGGLYGRQGAGPDRCGGLCGHRHHRNGDRHDAAGRTATRVLTSCPSAPNRSSARYAAPVPATRRGGQQRGGMPVGLGAVAGPVSGPPDDARRTPRE
jgi:P-type conjugative transfer protein TrbJ